MIVHCALLLHSVVRRTLMALEHCFSFIYLLLHTGTAGGCGCPSSLSFIQQRRLLRLAERVFLRGPSDGIQVWTSAPAFTAHGFFLPVLV